jgi:hypothetical protein
MHCVRRVVLLVLLLSATQLCCLQALYVRRLAQAPPAACTHKALNRSIIYSCCLTHQPLLGHNLNKLQCCCCSTSPLRQYFVSFCHCVLQHSCLAIIVSWLVFVALQVFMWCGWSLLAGFGYSLGPVKKNAVCHAV